MRFPTQFVERIRPSIEGRLACVTGGCGFIGGHLIDALLSLGASIVVLDDCSNSTAEHVCELIDLEPSRVRFVRGSILDDDALATAVRGAAHVFHLAAIGSVQRSIEDPDRTWLVNATGTMRVLEAARAAGVGRVICSSSSSVYGNAPELPKVETAAPTPASPYAASKLAGEGLCRSWSESYGLGTVSLRYFNVFGPRQPADSDYAAVVPAFAARLLEGKRPVIYGDGAQTRDFTPVCNAVAANLLSTRADIRGQALNVGIAERTSVVELARLLAERLGAPGVEPEFTTPRPGEVLDSLASIDAARKTIGYEPIMSLAAGLDETAAWYQAQAAESREAGGG
ncbi:MAG: GDP-mannose 4,6-dehydratase [Phycisphaeraceae bacterium]|nr:MAG: GDP-mannose 4,6-dehydratase [Phycisphaeraceae bacterium]